MTESLRHKCSSGVLSFIALSFVFACDKKDDEESTPAAPIQLIDSNPNGPSTDTGPNDASKFGYGMIDGQIDSFAVTELSEESIQYLSEQLLPDLIFPPNFGAQQTFSLRAAMKPTSVLASLNNHKAFRSLNSFNSTAPGQMLADSDGFPDACKRVKEESLQIFQFSGDTFDTVHIKSCKLPNYSQKLIALSGIRCEGANFDYLADPNLKVSDLGEIMDLAKCDETNMANGFRSMFNSAKTLRSETNPNLISAQTTSVERQGSSGYCSISETDNGIFVHSPCRTTLLVGVFTGKTENIEKPFTGNEETTGPLYLSMASSTGEMTSSNGLYRTGISDVQFSGWKGRVDYEALNNPSTIEMTLSKGDRQTDVVFTR